MILSLSNKLVGFVVVSHHRRTAVERILGIGKPLRGHEEVAHITYSLDLRFGDEILDGLHQAVLVGHGQARAAPVLPVKRVGFPLVRGRFCWLNREGTRGSTVSDLTALGYFKKSRASRSVGRTYPGMPIATGRSLALSVFSMLRMESETKNLRP